MDIKEDIIPEGFYLCKNRNALDKILKEKGIDKKKTKIVVDIKSYPCILTIVDLSLECGLVNVYGINYESLKIIVDRLKILLD